MPEEARRLTSFPRNDLLDEPVLTGRVAELELLEHLGAPTTESIQGFDDPRIFWDLEWPCRLVMAIEYHQLSEEFVMHLDSLDVEHALRHIGVEVRAMEPSFDRGLDRFERSGPPEVDEFWSVIVEEPDGERALLVRNITERDARCRVSGLEVAEPHRSFFVEQTPG